MSIELIKKLRDITLVSIAECKKALEATDYNIDSAIEYLRKNNKNVANKKSSRETNHGLSAIALNETNTFACLIKISCETDFVSKNPEFANLAYNIANHLLDFFNISHEKSIDIDKLMDFKSIHTNSDTLRNFIENAISFLGENIRLNSADVLSSDFIYYYTHNKSKNSNSEVLENVGGTVCAVGLNGFNSNIAHESLVNFAKDIGMHITVNKPIAIKASEIPADLIEKEENFLRSQIEEDEKFKGKPEALIRNILNGRKDKFLQESTLEMQLFCKDTTKTIKQYVNEFDSNMSIEWFKLI